MEKDKEKTGNWFSKRFPLSAFNYKVPKHANTFLFSLGGITLIHVIILIVTGFILIQYYDPNPERANQSIRILMTQVSLGSFIRGLHVWAATFVTVVVILHLLRVLFWGSYKKPRELHWVFGVVLFVLMIALFFTGTVLKWDQEAYEAFSHAVATGALLGPLGFYFANWFAPNIPLLTKFFTLHTSILPLLLALFIVIHLFLIKTLKISPLPYKPKEEKSYGDHTFFQHFYKLFGYGLIVFGVLSIFAILFPPTLGPLPTEGIESMRPPWLFMGIFSIENWAGLPGLLWTAVIIIVLLFLIPFLDRAKSQMWKNRKTFVTIAAIAVLLLAGLTVNAYASKPKNHIGMSMGSVADIDNQTVAATIKQSLQRVDQMRTDVKKNNLTDARNLSNELKQTLDLLNPTIAGSTTGPGKTIKVDSLDQVLKADRPDPAKVMAGLNDSANALKSTALYFPVTDQQRVQSAVAFVGQLESAIDTKNKDNASMYAENLDSILDPVKDVLKDKDASVVNQLNTDGLNDALKDAHPDWQKAKNITDDMNQALTKAVSLLK